MKIKYNAPTSLTYAFVCVLVLLINQYFYRDLIRIFFTAPTTLTFDITNPLFYLRLFTHIAGHADWNHLVGNMAYILLLGPMLEETYGSFTMLLMIIVTGFVTGVLNACFFIQPLLGASGVVFMMILLASFTNHGKDEIPLTFILIVALYLGREIISIVKDDNISQFAHIAGGFCGSLFGFFSPERASSAKKNPPRKKPPIKSETARKNTLPPGKTAAAPQKKNESG
ncbi:rhomboid family intramembrane serine protease [Brucepastera parasyntrophica]|uniref:rhomboid family intramembrane serine protease n=1 Tax=Brucepastera parasyntrophica TaxID=2880008 RepID=UPI0034E1F2B9